MDNTEEIKSNISVQTLIEKLQHYPKDAKVKIKVYYEHEFKEFIPDLVIESAEQIDGKNTVFICDTSYMDL